LCEKMLVASKILRYEVDGWCKVFPERFKQGLPVWRA
jgi:hypothetical protein